MEKAEISKFLAHVSKCSQNEFKIVTELRRIVQMTLPDLVEKISYGVPYFSGKRRVCFIWPSVVPQGPREGVWLGFCYGYRMDDPKEILEKGSRKQVFTLTFKNLEQIDESLLQEYLLEARMTDLS
ncbi:hypothetical protein A9Q84_01290 [Halobacteriovorax marinus]|uniref:YdhG-like domain-containing protein n=1 Tax=Halobacteriovorax marinus TaxID=97084 RepID=A0A1Y5FIK5_9BACT|nr:hypothetical protein A9Q84_01290 [Halobacteriovorax marinus]